MAGPAIAWIKSPAGFLKLISLILIVICMGLYFHFVTTQKVAVPDPGGVLGFFGVKPPTAGIMYVGGLPDRASGFLAVIVLSTIFFILLYYLISFIADESEPREYLVTELMFLFIHAILAIVSGCLVFSVKEPYRREVHYIYFVLMLIVGLVMITDAVLTLIQSRNRDYY